MPSITSIMSLSWIQVVVIALPENLSFPEEILRESRKIAEYFWVNKSIPILFYLYLATVTLDLSTFSWVILVHTFMDNQLQQ